MSRTRKIVHRYGNTRKRWARIKVVYRRMERMRGRINLRKEVNGSTGYSL